MDAAAVYAYRHLDNYLIFPVSLGRYPDGLGRALVRNIPTLPTELNDWLNRTRRRMTGLLLEMKGPVFKGCCELSREPPMNSEKIKQVYTIDLDRLVFSVDNGAHFKLDSIPRGLDGNEWLRYLGQDGTGHRCLKPSTPHRIIAELQPQTDLDAIMEDTRKYHSLRARLVSPRDLASEATGPEFACQEISMIVLEALIGQYYGTLCNACQYEPSDPQFQRCAQWLLRAAAPNFLQLHLVDEDIVEPSLSSSSAIECTNRHQQGVFFRFRGCLVLLSARLDSDMHLRASVVRIVSRVRDKGIRSDFAVIWSIKEVVIVRISDDRVMHTPALPVLASYGTNESKFSESERLLASCLRPACIPSECKRGKPALPHAPTLGERGYSREIDSSRSIPTDVVLEIMKSVDAATYSNVFSRLTLATRAMWLERPRIGSYAVRGISPTSTNQIYSETNPTVQARESRLVAQDANGHRINLSLIYEGHPYLGNCAPNILQARSESQKRERLRVRWPRQVDENREKAEGIEGRLEIRPCGLYLMAT